ncbi:transglycosylase domain-containing protein [Luteolibacter sp. LG18]|uniref:transglycosylase domain-containing protein n=1 Tax=Luteolibacter sp. LG18 TaxID=2819286 RepID=UPI002B2BC93F|nr:penicillin-binding protein 1A [Luteolibacter sp. LG18]
MATRDTNIRKTGRKRRFYKKKRFWFGLLLFGLLLAVGGAAVFWEYSRPYREHAETYDLSKINYIEVPSVILDRNDKEIGRIFVQNRSVIPYAKIPPKLINTLIAGEDSRYWTHDGVDYIGICRAAFFNKVTGRESQGASTLTQQLARNAYDLKDEALRNKQTKYERKLIEVFLARRINKVYKKEEVLEFYLNRIYFGSGFHGIRSASLGYFGKEPEDLTTEECASIVGLIKNPTGLSPLNNLAENTRSRNNVLERMKVEGFIDANELARLKLQPVKLNPKPLQRGTSHLYERVADEIREELGDDALAAGGYRIHTTILSEAQNAAQEALGKTLAAAEARPGYANPKYVDYRKSSGKPAEYLQGAVLMIDHRTGGVLAHVGGRDYAQVPFDFIEMGRRPLGTAFFPFIYAAGLSGGLTPATTVADEAMDNRSVMVGGREGILGEWGMEIASPTYEGMIPARRALEQSKIAATVRFGQQAGLQRVIDTAAAMGLPAKGVEALPRLCVGWDSFSMKEALRAIATFGRGGVPGPASVHYVESVESLKGETVYRRSSGTKESAPAIDSATAFQVHSMLAGSLARGSSKGALDGLIERPFLGGGKGGTTADFQDTWFLGYNSRISCGVWTGFLQNNGRPIYDGAFSRDLAMPVWQAVMNAAAPSFGGEELKAPSNVVEVPVCRVSGQRATDFCYEMAEDPATKQVRSRSATFYEYFRKGTENLPFCHVHSGADGATSGGGLALNSVQAMDVIPIRPKAPSLLGDDPYHSEQPDTTPVSGDGAFFRRRTNVLDSLDLKDNEEKIKLQRPGKLPIQGD